MRLRLSLSRTGLATQVRLHHVANDARLGADLDAARREQEDAFADALLMSVECEGSARDEVYGALGLVGIHHRQVQDDGFALAQGLNGLGHFLEGARFHDHHFGNAVGRTR